MFPMQVAGKLSHIAAESSKQIPSEWSNDNNNSNNNNNNNKNNNNITKIAIISIIIIIINNIIYYIHGTHFPNYFLGKVGWGSYSLPFLRP